MAEDNKDSLLRSVTLRNAEAKLIHAGPWEGELPHIKKNGTQIVVLGFGG
jgi:hypothetical protein